MSEQATVPGMGLFRLAENQTAYLKAGFLGFGGSGKTYTAGLMAKGVYERLKAAKLDPKPVFMVDTETGSDWLVPLFKEWGIPLYVSKSRSFADLLEGVKAAEANGSFLIIDSITHFWNDVQESYKKVNKRTKLRFQDWGPIKATWHQFTDAYLNSQLHIALCGRAGYEYEFTTDDDGDKQLEKTGTKMKAETDMGYEPSLLVEMVREAKPQENGGKKKVQGQLWDHVAYVLKDRSTKLEGARLVNPSFEDFKPHFDRLNIGGSHVGVVAGTGTEKFFEPGSDRNFLERKKKVEILMEEIQGEIVAAFPGQSADEKAAKVNVIHEAFGTRSWKALEDMSPESLQKGLEVVQAVCRKAKGEKVGANGSKGGK